jgi:PPP family 3-phenylpropionic acid transporter
MDLADRPRHGASQVLAVSALYVAYFLPSGFHQPFFTIWLADRGVAAADISVVLSVPIALRIALAPVFGWTADRAGDRRDVIRVLAVLVLAFALVLGQMHQFWLILVFTALTLVSWQGISPIMDAAALNLVRAGIAPDYGRLRLWGSVSFIGASLAGGFILGRAGPAGVFAAFTGATACLVAAAFLLPPSGTSGARQPASAPASLPGRRWVFLAVLVAAALIQASHMAFNSFGSIFLQKRGYGDATIGALWALAAASEIGMFWAGPSIARHLRPLTVLSIAAGAAALRWMLFPLDLGVGGLVLLQVSQAATFSATYLGLMRFIATTVSERRAATAQSTYATVQGIASAGATLAAGPLFQAYGGGVFIAAGCLPLVSLTIVLGLMFLGRRDGNDG